MKELEALLSQRWILKSQDRELYYKIRDSAEEIKKIVSDKLGCQLLENPILVKLEKIPAVPESFMGIEEFTSPEEYAYLCFLLMFLEDMDTHGQFILSQLTEYISTNLPGEKTDWTLYTNRRRLVRVLRYAVKQGILLVTDGSDDVFMEATEGEVLYENTGASRYFMRNFPKDILSYEKPEDFQTSDWFAIDEDRGIARRHRVYKRLLFAPGMYRDDGSEEDFAYLKNYGRRLGEELETIFNGQLHLHRGSAFFIEGEDCHMGNSFPGNQAISDILLLTFAKIREKVETGQWRLQKNDTILLDRVELERLCREVKEEKGSGFTKQYRQMPDGEFIREVLREMERWTFLRCEGHQVILYPLAGKFVGAYPKDYKDTRVKRSKNLMQACLQEDF